MIAPERHPLARRLDERLSASPEGVLWELVDAAADDEATPAGAALTHLGPGDCVTVSVIAVKETAADAPCAAELLRAMVATFRARPVAALLVCTTEDHMIMALKGLGFVPLDVGEGAYMLTL